MRSHVIRAIFKRNVASYFSGVLGYLFIVVFVIAAAFLAYNQQFFANNLATLDQLNAMFPILLLFIVPAITMGLWADEKKQGTEELLFTLPATDLEIVLGKYFAALAVYTIALLFSVFQVFVLAWYADPDWGLIFTTYFGYWLAGAALLSAGMFASGLSGNTTVAFVLGVAICAIPVFIGRTAPSNPLVRELSLSEQFAEFGMGTIPLNGLLYFVTFTALMLYLNLVLVRKRHWSSGQQANMGAQYAARTACLVVVLVSLNLISRATADTFNLRVDMTADQTFTLSDTTEDVLAGLDEKTPVVVQAFLSSEVPREYVAVHRRLNGLLRQYDRLGGTPLEVRFVDVEPYGEQAEEATRYGIQSRQVQTERDGRMQLEDVFLGVVVTSPQDEVVIPFFDPNSSVEYELTSAVRAVSDAKKHTIGVLKTDAQVFGGTDAMFRDAQEWQIITELKKLYNVEEVDWVEATPGSAGPQTAYEPIDDKKYDVLLAVMPSSLNEGQMQRLVEYVEKGRPAVILDDPFTAFNMQLSPRLPKEQDPHQAQMARMFGQQMPTEAKASDGRATGLMNALEVSWNYDEVVWDMFAPHPEFASLTRREVVFIRRDSGTRKALNPDSPVTEELQEVLTFFPGTIRERTTSDLEFTPLLLTSPSSGTYTIFEPGPFGQMQLKQDVVQIADKFAHVVAAHIKSKGDKSGPNVIFVSDVDMVSDNLFDIVRYSLPDLRLDNMAFLMNAIDYMAGDTGNLDLRNRRAKPRALTEIQKQINVFRARRQEQEEKAEKEAAAQLAKAQERLDEAQKKIEESKELDAWEKTQRVLTAAATETRQLAQIREEIEQDKQQTINRLKAAEQRQIRSLENRIRLQAVLLPPIPALALGLVVLSLGLYSERREIDPARIVRR